MPKPQLAFHSPEQIKAFREFYIDYAYNAASYWANKDRPDFLPEWWMHMERNDISKRQLTLIPDLKGRKCLGIGAAHITEEKLIEELGLDVTKIDIVGEYGGIGVIEMDACDMDFKDESFDVIICREVIEHVLNDQAMWMEMKRVLKPKGYLHLTTPNAYNLLPDGRQHLRGYSPNGLLNTATAFGFKILAKEGNAPNVFHSLIPLAMTGQYVDQLLDEFKQITDLMRGNEWSYYVGSLMMILAQKGG